MTAVLSSRTQSGSRAVKVSLIPCLINAKTIAIAEKRKKEWPARYGETCKAGMVNRLTELGHPRTGAQKIRAFHRRPYPLPTPLQPPLPFARQGLRLPRGSSYAGRHTAALCSRLSCISSAPRSSPPSKPLCASLSSSLVLFLLFYCFTRFRGSLLYDCSTAVSCTASAAPSLCTARFAAPAGQLLCRQVYRCTAFPPVLCIPMYRISAPHIPHSIAFSFSCLAVIFQQLVPLLLLVPYFCLRPAHLLGRHRPSSRKIPQCVRRMGVFMRLICHIVLPHRVKL